MTRPTDTSPTGLCIRDLSHRIITDIESRKTTRADVTRILRMNERTGLNPQRIAVYRGIREALAIHFRSNKP